jgi:hypothetical protein
MSGLEIQVVQFFSQKMYDKCFAQVNRKNQPFQL